MSDSLRAALEAAYQECLATLLTDWTQENVNAIYERHVLAWMREKAGEDVKEAMSDALAAGLCAIQRELLPLFAALRARIEELESKAEDHHKLIRMQIERTLPAMRNWQEAKGKPSNLYPDLGELVQWLMVRAEEAERCATESAEIIRRAREGRDALREIAREAMEKILKTAAIEGRDLMPELSLACAALRAIAGEKEGK